MRRELPMILVRAIVGLVFIFEGVLKFALPAEFGAGSFAAIGLPFSHILAPAVGGVEIAGGLAVLFNFYAGEASLLLSAIMITALVATKLPVLLGRPLGPFNVPHATQYGWIAFLHAARVELAMLFSALAILIDSGLRVFNRRRWYEG
jgi:uncharacterized membrane protein YphA (DoxX/SURF4 family)